MICTSANKIIVRDPRVCVSYKRKQQLKKAAKREGLTVPAFVERVFAASDML